MTTATLTQTEKVALLRDLDEASLKSSNCYATGYRDMRRVLALWGFDVSGNEAQRIHRDLSNEITSDSEIANNAPKRAAAAKGLNLSAGMTISYLSPLGEKRTGVVKTVSKSGKTVDVIRADGKPDIASRNIQVI